MKWYARELGYGAEEEHWGIVGLLHDIDFELYPAEHCLKAPELLREDGVSEDIIHGVVSHGYGITIECGVTLDVEPVHEMEKVLFAADELTGLIWAAALMRPSKSTKDMELKSLKKNIRAKALQQDVPEKLSSAELTSSAGRWKTADHDTSGHGRQRGRDQPGSRSGAGKRCSGF